MIIRQALPLRRQEPIGEDSAWLRAEVERLSVPRHGVFEAAQNRRTATYLARKLEDMGYRVRHQGPHRNVVALPRQEGPYTLVCAHYDSVPNTPGADDNASAVAVLLGAARRKLDGVAFALFNREEDGMLGSADFVAWLDTPGAPDIRDVHVLEMVGYTDPRPGAQRPPPPLPGALLPRDQGDFIGVVGLGAGHRLASHIRNTASGALGVPPVVSLQAPALLLHVAPDLGRSDHLPFVVAGRPAVMWTDTAEFRTPHYHQITDTPDTLDYGFMSGVLKLLCLSLATGEPPSSKGGRASRS